MKNSKRLLTASAVALVLSGGCTAVLSWTVSRSAVSAREVRTSYAAPTHPVAAGKALEAADLHMVEWPASSPVQGAFARVEDALGRTALYPLVPGQPVLESDLSARGAGPGLAGRIPSGMRALALRSDEIVGVAGFLGPGSHVDMLVTFHSDGGAAPSTVSTLQDVEVIAVGQQSEPDPQGRPSTATVVTLLLTPEQAQRALLASSQGTVHFVLRNNTDQAAGNTAPSTLADLGAQRSTQSTLGMMAAAPKKPAVPRPIGSPLKASAPMTVETVLNQTTGERKPQ